MITTKDSGGPLRVMDKVGGWLLELAELANENAADTDQAAAAA
jgi:hypothetical protein